MKNKKPIALSLVLSTIMILIIINSCKKGGKYEAPIDNTYKAPEIDAAKNYAEADMLSNDIINIANAAIMMKNDSFTRKYDCTIDKKQINLTNNQHYYQITIDFGKTNTNEKNQRPHKGKILISYSGKYFLQGFTDTITFDHFYISNSLIEGRQIITNTPEITKKSKYSTNILKSNNNVNLSWRVDAQNIKITHTDNSYHFWNSARLFQQNENDTTLAWDSYTYAITGQSQGTDINNVVYTAIIKNPLNKSNNCLWVNRGIVSLSFERETGISLNYGEGTCDKEANITAAKTQYPITLP